MMRHCIDCGRFNQTRAGLRSERSQRQQDSLGQVELREAVEATQRLRDALQLVVVEEKHLQGITEDHGKLDDRHYRYRHRETLTTELHYNGSVRKWCHFHSTQTTNIVNHTIVCWLFGLSGRAGLLLMDIIIAELIYCCCCFILKCIFIGQWK